MKEQECGILTLGFRPLASSATKTELGWRMRQKPVSTWTHVLFRRMEMSISSTWLRERVLVLDPRAVSQLRVFAQSQAQTGRKLLAWVPFSGFLMFVPPSKALLFFLFPFIVVFFKKYSTSSWSLFFLIQTRAIFGFKYHTAYLSITYFDRFFSKRVVHVSKILFLLV